MKNIDKPILKNSNEDYFLELQDKIKLFIHDYHACKDYKSTIFIISGISGINHIAEKDIIVQLSNSVNRVVVIHPRGTGYSDGVRGDISDFSDFINHYSPEQRDLLENLRNSLRASFDSSRYCDPAQDWYRSAFLERFVFMHCGKNRT